MKKSLLNADEERYLSSLESIVLVDPNDIRVLADEVARTEYEGLSPKPIRAVEYVDVTAYVPSKPRVSFRIWAAELEVADAHEFYWFRNTHFSLCLEKLRPQVRPFEYRTYCAQTLQSLHMWLRNAEDPGSTYPPPSKWCDAIERSMRARHFSENRIRGTFVCPSIREGRCHYAMNPDCWPDSPPDTVLLFETEAAWNQHGGPGLFTFNNHDPKGGCVLFKDGTVRFVRTEEELKQLRWK